MALLPDQVLAQFGSKVARDRENAGHAFALHKRGVHRQNAAL